MTCTLFESLLGSKDTHAGSNLKPKNLAFDDEPLERILYEEPLPGPTPANLFGKGIDLTRKLAAACKDMDIQEMTAAAKEFARERPALSLACCFDLTQMMKQIVPQYPCPILDFDLSPFGPVLEDIWELAVRIANESLQDDVGCLLYRWYEHHGSFEQARRILTRLIEIRQQRKDSVEEAVYLNNLAFEYLLEKRWSEAIPLFEKAAEMFKNEGQHYDHANSRANLWACCFETSDFVEMEAVEKELEALSKILGDRGSWHSRKPLILLAKINEQRGDIAKAIQLVEKAIDASKDSKTRYAELDGKYLQRLKHPKA